MDAGGKCSDAPAAANSGQAGATHTASDGKVFTGPGAAERAATYEAWLRQKGAPTAAPAGGGAANYGAMDHSNPNYIGVRNTTTAVTGTPAGGAPPPVATAPTPVPVGPMGSVGQRPTPGTAVAPRGGGDPFADRDPAMRAAAPVDAAAVGAKMRGGAPPPANVTDKRPPGFATFDRSGYDRALQDLDLSRETFLGELDRLSGVDPFGNQAFLQKATDRAVAQASGTAAMARGGAAALAGANRTAQGVQAQATARGAQEMEQVRSRDEIAAGQLRGQNAQGLAGLSTQRAGMEVEVAAKETETLQKNLDQWIQYSGMQMEVNQRDVESLRKMATELKGMEVQLRGQDIAYRDQELDRMLERYGIDKGVQTAMKQISAQENMSTDEFIMGLVGMGAGLGGAAIASSDVRGKTDIRDPDLRDLQDYLGSTRGKLYRYKDPKGVGKRPGLNYGPMAQDLAKSKIGRTVVVDTPQGMYVDTARLALADHAALAELARDVAKLKARK